ncbi:uncharacterized protein LOC125179069 [Hyalella azteca]|uniref:Uncharacterized protein LOC125179069 n=1 Tax=Hyalella azteca TaxID=294128 RepID=A0A979FSL8_HYAAZ|nr:uncharacterized protein LOC125179069 [Hyalella azteca]
MSTSRGAMRLAPLGGRRSHSSGSMLSGRSGGSSNRSQRSRESASSAASSDSKEACSKGSVGSSELEGEVELWYRGEGTEHWRTCLINVRLQVTPTLQVMRLASDF